MGVDAYIEVGAYSGELWYMQWLELLYCYDMWEEGIIVSSGVKAGDSNNIEIEFFRFKVLI